MWLKVGWGTVHAPKSYTLEKEVLMGQKAVFAFGVKMFCHVQDEIPEEHYKDSTQILQMQLGLALGLLDKDTMDQGGCNYMSNALAFKREEINIIFGKHFWFVLGSELRLPA